MLVLRIVSVMGFGVPKLPKYKYLAIGVQFQSETFKLICVGLYVVCSFAQ